jgi:crotonobetainyl-CoA:carnitine CoA-transferase CaiB-like acyl-CoA transferase
VQSGAESRKATAPVGRVSGPLSGIRVVECASIVLGPLTGQYLGDMGADVIKVEAPEGDLTRRIGPQRSPGMGALFVGCNRNKRSVVLDLKNPRDAAIFRDLIATSDVFLNSIRPAATARLGLGYAELCAAAPRLVYCQVEGFGQTGPYASKAAYDDVVQALTGLAMLQTVVTGTPRYVPSIVADKITAIHAAYAIALALFHRERTGAGQAMNIPMFETMAAFNLTEHLWGHAFEPPLAPMGYPPVVTAARRPFKTQDGYLAVMPYTDADWHRFYRLIGREDLIADPRFGTFSGRQHNVEMVWSDLEAHVASRTSSEWTDLLKDTDIPFATVNSLEDLLVDPHLEKVGFWQIIEDPHGGLQRVTRSPIGFTETPPSVQRLPPRLGEHTAEVLLDIGVPPELAHRLAEGLQ